MKEKENLSNRGLRLISLTALLHFFGAVVTFFIGGNKVANPKLFLHLIRFFSGGSVHTSILTIGAAILIGKERKKPTSYFSQLIAFLATIYNLITLFFGTYCLFFLSVGGETSGFLNIQSVLGHFVAPFLTIFYFYLYSQTHSIQKKLAKTLTLTSIFPISYFFYVYILAKIYRPTNSLFPYIKKYPYFIFEGIAERRGKGLVVNFSIACLLFAMLCSLLIGTKSIYEKRKNG